MDPTALHPNARLYQRGSRSSGSIFSKTFPTLKLKSTYFNSFANETNDFYLFLHTKLFVTCWWMICALHASDVAFLVAMTKLYHWLLHDELAQYYLLDCLIFEISYRTLGTLIWCFAAMAGFQALALLRMVHRSLKSGKLTMAELSRKRSTSSRFSSAIVANSKGSTKSRSRVSAPQQLLKQLHVKTSKPSQPSSLPSCLHKAYHDLRLLFKRFIHNWIAPAFYINGRYFDDFFILQACLQAGFQIYQANRMSLFIATRWINNVMVAMIFLNCVSTPLVHWLVPLRNAPLRRLLELTISALLSFTSSVALPLVIFIKYIRSYDPATHCFTEDNVYNDVWWAKAVRENQLLFVTSPLVFVTTLWPHYNLLTSLMICQSMVHSNDDFRRVAVSVAGITTTNTFMTNPDGTSTPLIIKAPLRRVSQFSRTSTCSSTQTPSPRSKLRVLVRLFMQFLLCICGAFILVMHVFAQQAPEVKGCMLATKPWFHTGETACAVMNVNCHQRGILGHESQIEQALAPLNPSTLVSLVFTHCPQLEIPSMIRSFHRLDSMEIYNSSLNQWQAKSAPRQQDLPVLTSIYLIRSNLSGGGLPEGLVQGELPVSLMEMFFYETNLTRLPDDLHLKWPSVGSVMLDFSALHEFPPVLTRMDLSFFDFTGNALVNRIDVDLFANNQLLTVILSGSASLTALPPTTSGSLGQLIELYLEHTQLQSVPEYIQHWFLEQPHLSQVHHSVFGSAFCFKASVASPQEREYQQKACAKDLGTTRGGYPIDYVASQRLP